MRRVAEGDVEPVEGHEVCAGDESAAVGDEDEGGGRGVGREGCGIDACGEGGLG